MHRELLKFSIIWFINYYTSIISTIIFLILNFIIPILSIKLLRYISILESSKYLSKISWLKLISLKLKLKITFSLFITLHTLHTYIVMGIAFNYFLGKLVCNIENIDFFSSIIFSSVLLNTIWKIFNIKKLKNSKREITWTLDYLFVMNEGIVFIKSIFLSFLESLTNIYMFWLIRTYDNSNKIFNIQMSSYGNKIWYIVMFNSVSSLIFTLFKFKVEPIVSKCNVIGLSEFKDRNDYLCKRILYPNRLF